MLVMRFILLTICFLLLLPQVARAQARPGSLRGTLVDSLSGEPLAFASVALLPPGQDTLIGGGLTDARGRFVLRDLALGAYRLRVQAIGYRDRLLDSLLLTPTQIALDLGILSLAPALYQAETVEITGERPFQELAPDRRIYRVSQLPLAEGGTAPDILRQIPSLSVTLEGALALRGDGQVALFIDGRPSPLTGAARAAFLAQLPANSIERVEVITNPSSRFDPEGTAGIINLVLKKDLRQGLSGSLNLTAGTRHKYQPGTLLNYRTRAYNFMLSYSYRYEQRFARGRDARYQPGVKLPTYIDQEAYVLRRNATHFLNPILDLYLTPRQTLTIGTIVNTRRLRGEETYDYAFRDLQEVLYLQTERQTRQEQGGNIFDLDIDYDKRFAQEGRSLYANASYATFYNRRIDDFTQFAWPPNAAPGAEPDEQQRLEQVTPSTTLTLLSDYVHPRGQGGKVEAGFSYRRRTFGNDYAYASLLSQPGSVLPDTSVAFDFSYLEAVLAAYTNLSGKAGDHWSWQGGLRAEQVFTEGSPFPAAAGNRFENDYFRLFPSAYLTYQAAKRRSWQLSYARRINRPSFDAVNPYPAYTDPYNLILGNPGLLPEDVHSGELTYTQQAKRGSLTAALYGRRITQVIRRVQVPGADGIAEAIYRNNPWAQSAGAEFIANGRVNKWWSGSATLNLFYARYALDGGAPAGAGWSWQFQTLSNLRLPAGFMAQISGEYRGPRPLLQGRVRPVGWVDIALRKTVLKRQGAIILRVSDVFNTQAYTQEITGLDFEQTRYRNLETQIAYLTFSYRFGKPARRRDRPESSDEGRGAGNLEEANFD